MKRAGEKRFNGGEKGRRGSMEVKKEEAEKLVNDKGHERRGKARQ